MPRTSMVGKVFTLFSGFLIRVAPLVAQVAIAQDQASLLSAGNGTVDAEVETARNLLEIRSGTESTQVALRISTQLSSSEPARSNGVIPSSFTSLGFTLAGPLDKSSNATDLATLDGLSNSVNAGVKLNRFHVKRLNPFLLDEWPAAVEEFCKRIQANDPEFKCESLDSATVLARLGPAALDRFDQLFFTGGTFVYGGQAKVGIQKFDYRDPDSFEKKDTNEVPWSAGAHIGYATTCMGLLTTAFRYERTFKDAASRTVCTPIPGSDQLECASGPSGDPNSKDAYILSASLRRQLPLISSLGHGAILQLERLAIAPQVSFDFEEDVLGIDLPVYLWGTSDGLLNGGIRPGWRDDTDDVTVSLFVGSNFGFFD